MLADLPTPVKFNLSLCSLGLFLRDGTFHSMEDVEFSGLEGLLAYMDRPPVSLRRLTYRPQDGLVHYQGTKVHPRLGTDHQLLPPADFLALLAGHVLLRYEVTIRSYGALSTTLRKRVGWVEAPPLKEPPAEALAPLPPAPPAPRAAGQHILPPPANRNPPSDDENDFTKKRRRNWARLIAGGSFPLGRPSRASPVPNPEISPHSPHPPLTQ